MGSTQKAVKFVGVKGDDPLGVTTLDVAGVQLPKGRAVLVSDSEALEQLGSDALEAYEIETSSASDDTPEAQLLGGAAKRAQEAEEAANAPGQLTGDALAARAAELNIEGRGTMKADALREAIAKAEAEGAGS